MFYMFYERGLRVLLPAELCNSLYIPTENDFDEKRKGTGRRWPGRGMGAKELQQELLMGA